MKTYTTTDGNKIQKVGREKKIFFDNAGNPYFKWSGRKQSFDDIPRLHYPIMYEDENGKMGAIGGYITLCNVYGVLVEVNDNAETVQLWEELTNE